MDEPIHCVFAVDDSYCQHLSAALISIFTNNLQNRLAITIVYGSMSHENMLRLQITYRDRTNVSVVFHQIDTEMFCDLPEVGHLTLATYFRLFLPLIMPADLEQVLYLDADLIARSDLRELWSTSLGDKAIAAAPDPHSECLGRSYPDGEHGFNAGVMLINLALWRAENLVGTFVDCARANRSALLYCDQDILNFVLHGRVCFLDLSWNCQSWFKVDRDAHRLGVAKDELQRALADPKIVHFSSQRKPWNYRDDVAFEQEYIKYIKKTPWRSSVHPDKTARLVVKRMLKRWAPSVLSAYRAVARARLPL